MNISRKIPTANINSPKTAKCTVERFFIFQIDPSQKGYEVETFSMMQQFLVLAPRLANEKRRSNHPAFPLDHVQMFTSLPSVPSLF